ncbi:hypothetical protein L596_008407 [Steinernema carpocapsae]|uniref:Uncharacterized protein n=1 Tax=Steinernema carpocapsae TaxID=34508 RepID=A0A4U5PCN2_STECR|nr:hypothetical protein L596_008407 [Steinernema carpocapsae]
MDNPPSERRRRLRRPPRIIFACFRAFDTTTDDLPGFLCCDGSHYAKSGPRTPQPAIKLILSSTATASTAASSLFTRGRLREAAKALSCAFSASEPNREGSAPVVVAPRSLAAHRLTSSARLFCNIREEKKTTKKALRALIRSSLLNQLSISNRSTADSAASLRLPSSLPFPATPLVLQLLHLVFISRFIIGSAPRRQNVAFPQEPAFRVESRDENGVRDVLPYSTVAYCNLVLAELCPSEHECFVSSKTGKTSTGLLSVQLLGLSNLLAPEFLFRRAAEEDAEAPAESPRRHRRSSHVRCVLSVLF